MAKKTRRARKASQAAASQVQRTQRSEAVPGRAVMATSRPAPTPSARKMTTAQAAVNFREEYHYVLRDLRRVGILALVMFALLIALALGLPALGL